MMLKKLIVLMLCSAVFATVSSTTTKTARLEGDGSDTTFTFSFPYSATSEIKVDVIDESTDTPTRKTETTDYSVSPSSSTTGGTVTFVTAPDSDEEVVISRTTSNTQQADIDNQIYWSYSKTAAENALDKLTRLMQEQEDWLGRCIYLPVSEDSGYDGELPGALSRATGYLYFGDDGAVSVATGLTPDDVTVSAFNEGLLDDASGTAWLATFAANTTYPTMRSTMGIGNFINVVTDYGATGDGVTDDYSAISSAVTAAGANGVVFFPAGTYLCENAKGTYITLLDGQQLIGEGWGAIIKHDVSEAYDSDDPGVFLITGAVSNIGIRNLSFVGSQDDAGTNSSGTHIMIQSSGETVFTNCPNDIVIENCKFNDGWQAVSINATQDDTASPWNVTLSNLHIEDHEHGIHIYNVLRPVNIDNIIIHATGRIQRGIGTWFSSSLNISNINAYGDDWEGPVIFVKGDDDDPAIKGVTIDNVILASDVDAVHAVDVSADTDAGGTSAPIIDGVTISNVTCHGDDVKYSVMVQGQATGYIENVSISNVTSFTDRMWIEYANDVTITGCALESTDDTLTLEDVEQVSVTGCTFSIDDGGDACIVFNGSSTNVTIAGNMMHAAGYSSTPRGVEVWSTADVSGLLVTGNIFYQIDQPMNIDGPVDNGAFTNNYIWGGSANEFNVDAAGSGTWSGVIDRNYGMSDLDPEQDDSDITLLSDAYQPVIITTSGTVTMTRQQSGTHFINTGATDTVEYDLPNADVGLFYYFTVIEDTCDIFIDPLGTDTVALATGVQQAAGKYITADATGETCKIICLKKDQWEHHNSIGTWTAEP
jgi:hypothetical protein